MSAPPTSQAVTIDTAAPTAAVRSPRSPTDSGTVDDFITSDTTLTVSGTNGALGAGEKVQVSSDGGATWGDVTQDDGTTWSYVDPATARHELHLPARMIDVAGNVGTTDSQAVTIDTAAPTAAVDDHRDCHRQRHASSDFITSDTTLTVSGTHGALGAGEKVQVSSDGGATWADVTQARHHLELYRPRPARHELHLPGADRRRRGQCRRHRQPGRDHRHGGADGGGGDHRDHHRQRHVVDDFITSDTTLTVSGTNGALGAGEKVQVSSDGGATWADVTSTARPGAIPTPPTTHGASPTRRGSSTSPATSATPTARR